MISIVPCACSGSKRLFMRRRPCVDTGFNKPIAAPKMEWIPLLLVTFKALVFGIGMFLAIKWHYDREKEARAKEAANGKTNDQVSTTSQNP